MYSMIPFLSRFIAARHQDAGRTLPTASEDVSNKPYSTDELGLAPDGAPDGNRLVEIPDSEEEGEVDDDVADCELRNTGSKTLTLTRLNNNSLAHSSMPTGNISPLHSLVSSDDLIMAMSDPMEVCSEEDDGDLATVLPAKFSYDASHEARKDVYLGPRSSAWKDRNDTHVEVVVLQKSNNIEAASDEELVRRELSIPEGNIVTKEECRLSTKDSMSNCRRKVSSCNHGGRLALSRSYSFVLASVIEPGSDQRLFWTF